MTSVASFSSDVRRVLLVNTQNIGDVVLCTPLLDALHRLFPMARIECIVKNLCTGLLDGDERVARVHGFDYFWPNSIALSWDAFRSAWATPWRQECFDLAILTHADLRANVMLRLWAGRAPLYGLVDRQPHYSFRSRLRSAAALLTHPVYDDSSLRHEAERVWLLANAVDEQQLLPEKPFLPSLRLAPLEERVCPPKPFMVVHPGANIQEKVWPVERMAAVVRELRGHFASVVVVGGARDMAQAASVANLAGEVDNRCGQMELRTLASLVSQAALYLGNDTGPTHMAAALGVPVVSIVDSEHQALRWGPYRPGDPTARAVWHLFPERESRCLTWPARIAAVTVEEVVKGCREVLAAASIGKSSEPDVRTGCV